jgi:hypothetical protein
MNSQEAVTLPAPVIDREPPPRTKWEREFQAFLRLLPELLPTYRGQYVAVHGERVVDSDVDEIVLILRVHAQHGYLPIHVDLVTEQPPPLGRIPHYREYHPEARK